MPWSAVEVRTATFGEDAKDVTVAEGDRAYELVYTSDTPLTDQPTFNVLLLDEQGAVRHVIVDVGGFLGIGERTVAVPSGAFQIDVSAELGEEEEIVSIDVSETTLENAPEFDEDTWTPAEDDNWDDDWNSFWENELDLDLNAND